MVEVACPESYFSKPRPTLSLRTVGRGWPRKLLPFMAMITAAQIMYQYRNCRSTCTCHYNFARMIDRFLVHYQYRLLHRRISMGTDTCFTIQHIYKTALLENSPSSAV